MRCIITSVGLLGAVNLYTTIGMDSNADLLPLCFTCFLSKVGGRRGTITGPFSTSPFRTVLAPFSAHGSPVDDSHSGSGSYTSRALLPFNCHPPVPLPHVSGITLSS